MATARPKLKDDGEDKWPKRKTYTATYERDAKGLWVAQVKGIAGCHTQGRTIAQARERIREALALFDEHAGQAQLEGGPDRVAGILHALAEAIGDKKPKKRRAA